MTDQEIIIEVAKLDGWTDFVNSLDASHGISGTHPNWSGVRYTPCPEYLTSRDAIIPVIEKQVQNSEVALNFYMLTTQDMLQGLYGHTLFATPRQLCIALLKATGKWKE